MNWLGWVLLGAAAVTAPSGRERIVGGACEGCELAFEGMPEAIPSSARIASADEPGVPLRLEGVVRDARGKPVAGVVVYAYHTNLAGIYPNHAAAPSATAPHGTLRGWAKTDAAGRYRFDTIRPGAYPSRAIPEHIHLHVIEPGRCTYYIDDVQFTDDPRLGAGAKAAREAARAGSGLVTPVMRDGRWNAVRDIVLGANVEGYDLCGR